VDVPAMAGLAARMAASARMRIFVFTIVTFPYPRGSLSQIVLGRLKLRKRKSLEKFMTFRGLVL
jgi:hypothetical protein